MLVVQNLRVEFGPRVLFSDLSFSVGKKERIAFAGHNGAGKSTLMKCLAKVLEPNAGQFSHSKNYEIGYLPQEGIHIKNISLWDEVASCFEEANLLQASIDQKYEELSSLPSDSPEYMPLLEAIGDLEIKLESFDPSRMKPKIESVLAGLGFSREDHERDCGHFSGGWQMRIAMAKLFLRSPDLLLLDEPTNHLDIQSQRWVEQFLLQYPGAIILISHDRSLLDTLTTRTIAFHHGRAEEYAGNYSFYQIESVKRKEILRKQYQSQQAEIKKAEDFINRFRAKASKATQAQSRLKQLQKMELIEIESEDAVLEFRFPSPPPSGHSVATLENAGQQYGDYEVFSGFDYEITKGEKVAIVGPNGAGKSTFCKMITGEEEPASGVFNLGLKVTPSFFSQNHADELDPDLSILETVEKAAGRTSQMSARNLLGCFLFRGDDVFKKIGVLSGGERSRVALVRMLVQPANFLILDEPTNHLDMESQDVLQKALQSYEGTIIIVSHNRDFLDPIITKTIEFRPQKTPRLFHGNLTYYLEKTEEDNQLETGKLSKRKSTASTQTKTFKNRKEQRRFEAEQRKKKQTVLKPLTEETALLENTISELEVTQKTLSNRLTEPGVSEEPEKLRQATEAYQKISSQLDQAISRWGDLSAQIEKVKAEY